MFKRRILFTLAVGFLTSTCAVGLLAIPTTSNGPLARTAHGICYCGCDKMSDHARCPMMCDLPQFADRWWATSCHKRAMTPALTPAPTAAPAKPAFHTTRRYRYLQAQAQPAPKPAAPRVSAAE
jgi:hypothetical protein